MIDLIVIVGEMMTGDGTVVAIATTSATTLSSVKFDSGTCGVTSKRVFSSGSVFVFTAAEVVVTVRVVDAVGQSKLSISNKLRSKSGIIIIIVMVSALLVVGTMSL